MKKLLLNTLLIAGLFLPFHLSAEVEYNENITDIYFGNGVGNTYIQAEKAKFEIREKLISKSIIQDDEIFDSKEDDPMLGTEKTIGKKYAFKVAYN